MHCALFIYKAIEKLLVGALETFWTRLFKELYINFNIHLKFITLWTRTPVFQTVRLFSALWYTLACTKMYHRVRWVNDSSITEWGEWMTRKWISMKSSFLENSKMNLLQDCFRDYADDMFQIFSVIWIKKVKYHFVFSE